MESLVEALADGMGRICDRIARRPPEDQTVAVQIAIMALLMCCALPEAIHPAFPITTRPARRKRLRGRLRVVREEG